MFHVAFAWFLCGVAATLAFASMYGTLTQCAALLSFGG